MQSIAYLGPAGSYSEQAAIVHAGQTANLLPVLSFPAIIAAVEDGVATEGVLPAENMLEGAVSAALDILIHETALRISSEVVVPIQQCLAAPLGRTLAEIKLLYGHPQSLAQCRRFIERCLPGVTTIASLSNSAAPADAMSDHRAAGAISTPRAAELAGAAILASAVADDPKNVTRFLVLSTDDHPPTGDDKTSFCFGFDRADQAGDLMVVLAELAKHGINMTKLESRPAKDALGRYIFLVDINGHRTEPSVAEALIRIAERTDVLKIFGSYPRWKFT